MRRVQAVRQAACPATANLGSGVTMVEHPPANADTLIGGGAPGFPVTFREFWVCRPLACVDIAGV